MRNGLLITGFLILGMSVMGHEPKSTDGKLETYFKEAKFYDYAKAYQHRDTNTGIAGIHSPSYNISVGGTYPPNHPKYEPFGNGNLEFPWANPAMTDGTETITKKFIWQGKNIHIWSDTKFGKNGSIGARYQDTSGFWYWEFQTGTVFGEVLCFKDGTVYEVRTRTKGTNGEWAPQVYRPFTNVTELEKASGIRIPKTLQPDSIIGQHMKLSGYKHELPEIPNAKRLLQTTTFKPVLGLDWLRQDKHVAYSYTGGGLTPAGYKGGLLEVSKKSCNRCHEDTGKNVNDFDQPREWYGHIRGNDRIFSWHPFTKDSISFNGFWKPMVLR